jgi:hypothetical protein
MPMPLIINNRNELNASPLIINGRKLNVLSENKTIWSYKPDDRRAKVEFLLLCSVGFYFQMLKLILSISKHKFRFIIHPTT